MLIYNRNTTLPSSYDIGSHSKIYHYSDNKLMRDVHIRKKDTINAIKYKINSDTTQISLGIKHELFGPEYWKESFYAQEQEILGFGRYIWLTEQADIDDLIYIHSTLKNNPVRLMEKLFDVDAELRVNWERKWHELNKRLNEPRYYNYSNNKNIKGPPSLNFIITIFWKLGDLNNHNDHYFFFNGWDVQEMLDAVEARNNKIELVDKYTVEKICFDYDISFTHFKLNLIPSILIKMSTIDGTTLKKYYSIISSFVEGPGYDWETTYGNAWRTVDWPHSSCVEVYSQLSESEMPIFLTPLWANNFPITIQDYLRQYNNSKLTQLDLTIILL